ncbi:hypothetical protein [Pseudomonas fluorescens]|uniref:hypothetical protein n=1 Tax=Pseudomonas fluorescens TaxID=294 RepID=UPI001072A08C|nr:hypothetical protein [Pseudomonas fluorescens]
MKISSKDAQKYTNEKEFNIYKSKVNTDWTVIFTRNEKDWPDDTNTVIVTAFFVEGSVPFIRLGVFAYYPNGARLVEDYDVRPGEGITVGLSIYKEKINKFELVAKSDTKGSVVISSNW